MSGIRHVTQIYVRNIASQGDPYQLTQFPIAFSNVKYNAKKQLLTFFAQVYPGKPTLKGTKLQDDELKTTIKDSGMIFEHLPVRFWNTFLTGKRVSIFSVQLEISGGHYTIPGEPRNLLAGTNLGPAPTPFGGLSTYDISPDGEELAFVTMVATPDSAWKSLTQVYIIPLDGNSPSFAVSADIPASSSSPKYAPSGTLAYLQMLVPGNPVDRARIVLYDGSTRKYLAKSWDRSPSELAFSPDSSKVYAVAEEYGRKKIFSIDVATEQITTLINDYAASGISVLPSGKLVFSVNSMQFPNTVHVLDIDTGDSKSMGFSSALDRGLSGIVFGKQEEFEFTGVLGDQVHGWLIKPPTFREGAKCPVLLMIHGGPQAAWDDTWSPVTNPQVFASAGFAIVAINYHGSTGYGQKFSDSIEKNWGSHPYHDLEKGLDFVLKTYSFLDSDRIAAYGESFGGYMVNWINGHSNRFKCLVNYDGVFSPASAYYTLDVLGFFEYQFGGVPFDKPGHTVYEQWSPANFLQNWRTPTLVVHSGHDYRLADSQGLSTFTALQRQKIPSRLLYFPDEGHFVLKPANSLRWYKEVIQWITKWTQQEE
ncbi:Alpha/Beta hydrolase protein [Fennellomyces sp. T-0311]|nr:Alpha/Beta hydrolase protein [Fennellomyces sp. T-0311]